MGKITFPAVAERWGIFEIMMEGPVEGNPFLEEPPVAVFKGSQETVRTEGFYDGEGVYRIRFMPSFEGDYQFEVQAPFTESPIRGAFSVHAAGTGNHGPVRVAHTFHFSYEDGTPYYPVGTTCYVWTHQPEDMQQQTLEELKKGYFNKIRFCVLPKHYDYNFRDPVTFPFEGTPMDNAVLTKRNFNDFNGAAPGNQWDFTRFNPVHFQKFEQRIGELRDMGIEADLIIMHPYDRWGFSAMDRETDDRYWRYVIARFSAYRNVWWSLANEYDLMNTKTQEDWERYAAMLVEKDPYRHLRSIHNCAHFYDYTRPWVTHCSIQTQPVRRTVEMVDEWRLQYHKPVVIDEMCYEGNIDHDWGNISPQEMVRRFWETTLRGGYAGHGETYVHPEDKLWWSHGGPLHGESPARLKFLLGILQEFPWPGIRMNTREQRAASEDRHFDRRDFRLVYFGVSRPKFRRFWFDDIHDYSVDVIDTWHMTVTPAGTFRGRFEIPLPGTEYMALRIRRITH